MTTTTPTPEQLANRRAWIAALRSGNYRQAHMTLRRHDRFCCLGVAEDVTDCEWRVYSNSYQAYRPSLDESEDLALTSLTRGARALLGLKSRTPYVTHWNVTNEEWECTTLVGLNDNLRYDFAQIASVIEDQPEDWDGTYDTVQSEISRRNDRLEPPPSELLIALDRSRRNEP